MRIECLYFCSKCEYVFKRPYTNINEVCKKCNNFVKLVSCKKLEDLKEDELQKVMMSENPKKNSEQYNRRFGRLYLESILYRAWYILYRVWYKIKEFPSKVKWFIQRGKRGWADEDVWSLDFYLVDWLPDALRRLKTIKKGCPPEYFDENAPEGEKCRRFDKELDLIIEGFEAARKIQNLEYNLDDYEILMDKFNKGFDSFRKNFFALWN